MDENRDADTNREALSESGWSSTRAISRDVISLSLATIVVQGASQVGQVIGVRILSTSDFAAVRVSESLYSIALLLACWGGPTLAIRVGARARARRERVGEEEALRRLILATSSVSCVLLILAMVSPRSGLKLGTAVAYGLMLYPVALTRVRLGLMQGLGLIATVAATAAIMSVAGVAVALVGAWRFGAIGWAYGRLAGELAVLTIILAKFRVAPSASRTESRGVSLRQSVSDGLPLATGLAVRSALDSASLLVAKFWGLPADSVALIGLLTLAITLGSLPAGLLGNALLPRLVSSIGASQKRQLIFRGLTFAFAVGMLVSIVLFLSFFAAEREGWISTFNADAGAIALLLLIPMRSVASMTGTCLFAEGMQRYSALITVGTAIVMLVTIATLPVTARALAGGVLAVELAGMLSMLSILLSRHRRSSALVP
jgi:O-antigen/teichoic acid export membrane protein